MRTHDRHRQARRVLSRSGSLLAVWGLFLVFPMLAAGYSFDTTVLAIPSQTFGVALESCELPSGSDVTLTTASAWESALESASPGQRFFLRAGTYTTTELVLPNGTAAQRIQLKPYNCEAVTLNMFVKPGSYTTVAGFTLQQFSGSAGLEGTVYFTTSTTSAIVRNNAITHSGHYAVSFLGGTQTNLLFEGNDIFTNTGSIQATTVYVQTAGSNAIFRGNKLWNSTATGGEDVVQSYNWSGTWRLERNWFSQNASEDFMDIKYSTLGQSATMTVLENYFEGANLPFGSCLLMHNASDIGVTGGYLYTVNAQGNYFHQCFVEHTIHDTDADNRVLVATYNIFHQGSTAKFVIIESNNGTVTNNTFLSGTLKTFANGHDPANCVVQNNIFYQGDFVGFSGIDTCNNNDFYQTTNQGSCATSLTSNPQFVNPASDWHLQAGSPALGAGVGGLDLGAYQTAAPTGLLPQSALTASVCDSESTIDGLLCGNVRDGNLATMWHTQYTPTTPPLPHSVTLTLDQAYTLTGIRYTPRQDGIDNGTIQNYEVYTSTDNSIYTLATSGTLASDQTAKDILFAARQGAYVRLVATSEINGNQWTSAAEIQVYGTAGSTPSVPTIRRVIR